MPSIITDEMIKKMCSMSNPIPLQSTGFLNPDLKKGFVPNYVKRGRGGIRYTQQPIYPPASVNSLIQSTVALSGLAESAVEEYIERAIEREVDIGTEDYRETFDNLASYFEQMMIQETNENEVEKYLSELYEQATTVPVTTPDNKERGVEETTPSSGATPNSVNRRTKGRGILRPGGHGRSGDAAEQLDFTEEGIAVETGEDISKLTPLKPRKSRNDKGLLRGKQKRTIEKDNMEMEDKPQTRAQTAAQQTAAEEENREGNIKLRLRRADGEF